MLRGNGRMGMGRDRDGLKAGPLLREGTIGRDNDGVNVRRGGYPRAGFE